MNDNKLNEKNFKQACDILKLKHEVSDAERFYFDREQLGKLIDNDMIDVEEAQNCSPTVGEFYEWLENIPNECIKYEGYIIRPHREDCRISIEGVNINRNNISSEDWYKLINTFHNADEFEVDNNELRAWWD